MFDRILRQMRELVRQGRYVMTTHADEEADADELSIFDIETAILTGVIQERQRDRESDEWKYLVRGQTSDGRTMCVVAKLGASKKLVYIVTAYED